MKIIFTKIRLSFRKLFFNDDGVSIIVAMFFVFALMIITIDVMGKTQRVYRNIRARSVQNLLDYTSHAAAVSVAARIEEHKAGYTTDYARDVRIENFYKSGGKDCSESLNATTGSNVLTCNDGAVSFSPQNYDIVARKRTVSRPEVKLRFDATGYTGEYYTIPMVYLSHDDKPIATGSAAKRWTRVPRRG